MDDGDADRRYNEGDFLMMTWVALSMWLALIGMISAAGDLWDKQTRFERSVTTVTAVFLTVPTLWFTLWVILPLYGFPYGL